MFSLKMKQNKKGLSEVIAVVLFILMAVSAIAILWASARPLFTSLSPEFDCTQARIESSLTVKSACYNSETRDIELTLTRKFSDNLEVNTMEFTIVFEGKENLEYYCGTGCEEASTIKPGETKTYFFNIEDLSGIKNAVVGFNGCALVSSEQITECEA